MKGRNAFLSLLLDEGVRHLFGNPGTTELAIMQALPEFPELQYVLGLQEAVVLGMADGYARASQQLTACNLHCAPGLGNAIGALFSAKFSGSPVIVTAGQYELGYGLQEPLLYEPLVPLAQPLVKWAVEVGRADDLPRIIRRAAKVALSAPMGPVFISLPGSVLDEELSVSLGGRTRVAAANRPGEEVITDLVQSMLGAQCPVIIAGRELAEQDAFAELGALAQLLGAPIYQEPVAYNARFPSDHPHCMGALSRSQPQVHALLSQFDLVICLGADLLRMSPYSPVDPLPAGMRVVHVSERDWELGKNYSTEIALRASVAQTLKDALPALRDKQSRQHAEEAARRSAGISTRNWNVQREQACKAILASATHHPIDPAYMMMRLVDALPPDAIVVEECLTAAAPLAQLLPMRDRHSFYGLASGGLGFGLPGAIGIALAHPGRPIVATIGDGSAMYGIQALWTAAHLKLPITYVIVNNRSYRVLKERLRANRQVDRFIAMDLKEPGLDFVKMAGGFGMAARQISEPGQLEPVFRETFASGKPSLIEVLVANGFEQSAWKEPNPI